MQSGESVAMKEVTKKLLLRRKVALVTGASSGIGLAIARLFAAVGCNVALVDINEQLGKKRAQEIRSRSVKAAFYKCNITSGQDCKDTLQKINRDFKGIDIVVNAAGIIVRKDVVELSEMEWDSVLDTDLKGVFLVSHHAIPYMRDGGSIINIGSGWGLKGGPKAVSYCAAKGGVVNMTRAMAIDLGSRNIRVNCINPGDVDTPLLRGEAVQLGESLKAFMSIAADRPIKRVGEPEDIANAALYFASDLSHWVTGANLVVDGGGLA